MKMDHSLSQCTCTLTEAKQGRLFEQGRLLRRDAYWNEGTYSVGALTRIGALIKKNSKEGVLSRKGTIIGTRALNRIITILINMWGAVGFLFLDKSSATVPSSIIMQHLVPFNAIKTVLYQQPNAVLRCQSFFHSSPNGANQKGSSSKVREMFPSRVQTEKNTDSINERKSKQNNFFYDAIPVFPCLSHCSP